MMDSENQYYERRFKCLTSLSIHNVDSLNEEWTVGLGVFHKHYQQLQSSLHNQPRLKRQRERKRGNKQAALTVLIQKMAVSNLNLLMQPSTAHNNV